MAKGSGKSEEADTGKFSTASFKGTRAEGDDGSGRRISGEFVAEFGRRSIEIANVQEKLEKGTDLTVKEKKDAGKDLKAELEMDEHKITPQELLKRFDVTQEGGLNAQQVAEGLKKYGLNQMSPPKKTPEWIKFMKQMTGFFSLLLWGGAFLCFIGFGLNQEDTQNLWLGLVLSIVVFATGCFTYLQESKSSKIMEGFKKMVPLETVVKRDGKDQQIPARELVPGDIVFVTSGDKVPADIRILESTNLKVDNSSLTGEAEPQSRNDQCTNDNPLETKNLAFSHTLVMEGSGWGMVVNTADGTVIGRIAGLAASTASEETPIHKEISYFIMFISTVAITLGGTFFIIGFVIGTDPILNVVFAIGIIVANVPEGLLATVTVSLTLTAKRMKNKQVLVKHLESVETLGSTTTICSDKTGTLTQNNMSVADLCYDNKIFGVNTLLDNESKGDFDERDVTFQALQRCGCLCNKTVFKQDDEETKPSERNMDKPIRHRACIGDASETAIVKFCEPLRPILEHRAANPQIHVLPFNSTNKFMCTIHRLEDKTDGRPLLLMKGAPERIIDRSSHIMMNGKEVLLNDDLKAELLNAYETLGGKGERVLGFAQRYLDPKEYPDNYTYDNDAANFPMDGMVFTGLIALIDPPRANVPQAVSKCKTAGIKVIMVTGDHPITAKAIARQVNIIEGETVDDIAAREGIAVEKVDPSRADAIVVHGSEIKDLTDPDWERILSKPNIVFARTSPQQKLIIVENCQLRGEIVAVTGDGVNDSPALKKADIGVAMGISGSDVSKEAADMILMDDNFASIVNGVEEGRLIFDNLKKSIAYTLSSNIPEISPFLLFIVVGLPLPLTTVLILCIDLGTDMIPAISLAYEEKEADIMSRPPRDAAVDRLVNVRLISFAYLQIGVIQALAGFYVYFVVMNDNGFPPEVLPGLSLDWGEDDLYCWKTSSGRDCSFDLDDRPSNISTDDIIRHDGEEFFDTDYQKVTLREAQTAFFVCIVVVQWSDLLICKTRKLSILQQGMRNGVMNFGICSETVLAIVVCYLPGLDVAFGVTPIRFEYWLPGLPFCLFIFFYDEMRKFVMRGGRLFEFEGDKPVSNFVSRWLVRMTYW